LDRNREKRGGEKEQRLAWGKFPSISKGVRRGDGAELPCEEGEKKEKQRKVQPLGWEEGGAEADETGIENGTLCAVLRKGEKRGLFGARTRGEKENGRRVIRIGKKVEPCQRRREGGGANLSYPS